MAILFPGATKFNRVLLVRYFFIGNNRIAVAYPIEDLKLPCAFKAFFLDEIELVRLCDNDFGFGDLLFVWRFLRSFG
jgi:hypothetical protein